LSSKEPDKACDRKKKGEHQEPHGLIFTKRKKRGKEPELTTELEKAGRVETCKRGEPKKEGPNQ